MKGSDVITFRTDENEKFSWQLVFLQPWISISLVCRTLITLSLFTSCQFKITDLVDLHLRIETSFYFISVCLQESRLKYDTVAVCCNMLNKNLISIFNSFV